MTPSEQAQAYRVNVAACRALAGALLNLPLKDLHVAQVRTLAHLEKSRPDLAAKNGGALRAEIDLTEALLKAQSELRAALEPIGPNEPA